MNSSQAYVSQHLGCPFGAVASVHAWERVGAAICHIAQMFLMLPMLRYVDDYFCPDRYCHECSFRYSRAFLLYCWQAVNCGAWDAVLRAPAATASGPGRRV